MNDSTSRSLFDSLGKRFLGGCAFLAVALAAYLVRTIADLPSPAYTLGGMPTPSILIEDRYGRPLYEAIDPSGSRNVPLALEQIPLACRQATIATEDGRFYSHKGVDPLAIGRAMIQNLRHGGTVAGGSTLTQQLARSLFLLPTERNELTLRRKLREAWLSLQLEQRYSKDEILALYLNTTYYGHFAVGLEAAAQVHFGVHAAELDVAQCALLAGLPQYPAGYSPLEHPVAARERQAVVLGLMVEDGYLSGDEASAAKLERLQYAGSPFPISAPHFVMWVLSDLEETLGAQRLRSGGLRVRTTLDLDLQWRAEEIVAQKLMLLKPCDRGSVTGMCDSGADPSRRVGNAALLALEPASGAVLAMVGSPDFFDTQISGAVNATLSLRQPGSAIKPLTYAAAFDPERARQAGRVPWTAATVVADLRTAFITAEGEPYVPQNYDLRYHGPVTARTALANSYNIPAVSALRYVGVQTLVDLAGTLGVVTFGAPLQDPLFSEQRSAPADLALTLGGGEVRLMDLLAAYGALANGGRRITPYGILSVETLDCGELACAGADIGCAGSRTTAAEERCPTRPPLWRSGVTGDLTPSADAAGDDVASTPALDPRVAFLVTSILGDSAARRPAFGQHSVLDIGRPSAAKTGTTTDWRDNWTLGYTPLLAVGVWVGNADNSPMIDVSGVSGAGPIWHDFMIAALQDVPAVDFVPPPGLIQIEVCADSGLIPAESQVAQTNPVRQNRDSGAILDWQPVTCPARRLEWFIEGTQPTKTDDQHVTAIIDVRSGLPAESGTPLLYQRQEIRWLLSAEYEGWARENGLGWPMGAQVTPQRATGDEGGRGSSRDPIVLTSPDPARRYAIDPALPAAAQQLPVTASLQPGLSGPIMLTVNSTPWVWVGPPDYTAWWQLVAGTHVFQARAVGANGTEIVSQPVTISVQ